MCGLAGFDKCRNFSPVIFVMLNFDRMMKINRYLTLLCLCAGSLSVRAQVDSTLSVTLQNTVDSLLQAYQVKGISAAAYIPGQGIWYGAAGVSHGTTPV